MRALSNDTSIIIFLYQQYVSHLQLFTYNFHPIEFVWIVMFLTCSSVLCLIGKLICMSVGVKKMEYSLLPATSDP